MVSSNDKKLGANDDEDGGYVMCNFCVVGIYDVCRGELDRK